MSASQTVRDRVAVARTTLTPAQMALGLGLVALAGAALLFAQEPTVHDALHNFRHSAGITCH